MIIPAALNIKRSGFSAIRTFYCYYSAGNSIPHCIHETSLWPLLPPGIYFWHFKDDGDQFIAQDLVFLRLDWYLDSWVMKQQSGACMGTRCP